MISLLSKGLSRVFSSTTIKKHRFFGAEPSIKVQLSHLYMTPGKTIALTRWTFVSKVTSLLFNTHILIAIYKGGTSAAPISAARCGSCGIERGSVASLHWRLEAEEECGPGLALGTRLNGNPSRRDVRDAR